MCLILTPPLSITEWVLLLWRVSVASAYTTYLYAAVTHPIRCNLSSINDVLPFALLSLFLGLRCLHGTKQLLLACRASRKKCKDYEFIERKWAISVIATGWTWASVWFATQHGQACGCEESLLVYWIWSPGRHQHQTWQNWQKYPTGATSFETASWGAPYTFHLARHNYAQSVPPRSTHILDQMPIDIWMSEPICIYVSYMKFAQQILDVCHFYWMLAKL